MLLCISTIIIKTEKYTMCYSYCDITLTSEAGKCISRHATYTYGNLRIVICKNFIFFTLMCQGPSHRHVNQWHTFPLESMPLILVKL